jgi:cell wall-associated NlpC family hydrolase
VRILDIPVSAALLRNWVDWLAPDKQPFYLTAKQLRSWKLQQDDTLPDPNLRDTYRTYHLDRRLRRVWLDEAAYMELPQATRAGLVRAQVVHERGAVPSVRRWRGVLDAGISRQADGHRFVWWKSLLRGSRAGEVLAHVVSEDLGPSRHREVRSWPSQLLPNARALAGTWPGGSGANCFGTVMAAAGVEGAAETWMQREPFEAWLAANTELGGRDEVPGTVFVWRGSDDRLVQHAGVTLGGGYMLHKPSQAWSTPRKVRAVAEVRRATRTAGWRLERYSLG